MSHEITDTDGVFSVRKQLWHGLGKILPEYPTREEAQALAHPWEPVSEPMFRKRNGPPKEDFSEQDHWYEEVPGFKLNVRSDDGHPLGVVHDTFTTVLNSEMYEIAEAIEGEAHGSVKYETGGSLRGGAQVWLLLRLREPLQVAGDPHGTTVPYYALQDSKDGSGAFRGQATMVRLCCANTSLMADLDARARGTEFVFRHTKNIEGKIDQAKDALAGWRNSISAFQELTADLINLKVTPHQRLLFTEAFVPMPVSHMVSDRVVQNVESARKVLRDILAGSTCEGIDFTAYGLLQAATEYQDHFRPARSAESRFKRAYLTRSQVVADAVKLAREVAMA